MITLMVSHNCGMSYGFDSTAETLEELRPRMDELNKNMLRWYLEDESGEQIADIPCAVHSGILKFMENVNAEAWWKEQG